MAIFHFKHSHLNWRAIPCRKRNELGLCNPLFQHFLNLVFLIFVWTQSNFSSAWYDNQISLSLFFFAFFFFLSYSHDLNAPGNDAYHRWLSRLKHHFSCRNCFESVIFFCPRLFLPFLLARKGYGSKWLFIPFLLVKKGYSSKGILIRWVIVFLINMPQGINQG